MKTYLTIAAALIPLGAMAQQDRINDYRTTDEQGIIESIAKIEKKTDKFNLYLNMHGSFNADWNGSHFDEVKFKMNQLRIEAKGQINSWLSYRYRQRLNKGDSPNGYRDNLLNSIDIAGIGINLDKWSFFLGKQCASYGGIEFDLNPIEIYQYSDMVDYMSNFMSGVNIAYNFTPNQQLQFQVLNAYNGSSYDMYGNYEKAKIPMVYTLNWNGNFGDVYKTRWSASVMNETKKEQMWYFALGNDFNFSDKFQAYFDWMYSREGVDRKGIITDIVQHGDWQGTTGYKTAKTDIMSFVLHLNYRFHPAWNIFAKFMAENEGVYKTHQQEGDPQNTIEKGRYRTAWGYIGGIEYYPFKDRNLHFFATYIGRAYNYTDRAKAYGAENYTTNCLSVGLIWQMPVF
ncbi:MAG: OprO/OprP family phosphate-selective porin [Muribaculaceae bacterium]|nr:OprO/OprP family phosphate-selective porin [Muribaculaceae bacterium]